MKNVVNVLCLLALFCATPLVLAQSGSQLMHSFEHHLPGIGSRQMQVVGVTNSQRADLANCMAEAKQVQRIVDQMTQIGHPWGRGRISYSGQDLTVLLDRKHALDASLIALATSHRELRKDLVEVNDRAIGKRLLKLTRLEARLHSGSLQIDHDLTTARPGPGSPDLSWDLYALSKTAKKWQAEHRQIARELDLAM